MAPVTGGIADRQKDRLFIVNGTGQSPESPWFPVDGIAGVLEQVGAGGIGQSIFTFVNHAAGISRVLCRRISQGFPFLRETYAR